MAFSKISEIRAEQVLRLRTNFSELDWLYGYTRFPDVVRWGLPQGKISLWSGESGTGKSRAAIAFAKKLGRSVTTLYFQNEVPLTTFAGLVANSKGGRSPYLCGSDSVDLKSQIKDIEDAAPKVVFVDSINQLEEYNNGTKKDIKRLIEGYEGVEGYRDIAKRLGIHIILIAQLNKDGTVKGSSTLTHLVDICFSMTHYCKRNSGFFTIKVGSKHRYGRTGDQFYSVWKHLENGVECVSDYSLEDKIWCDTNGIAVRDMKKYFDSLSVPEIASSVKNKKVVAPKTSKRKRIDCSKREPLLSRLVNGALIKYSIKQMFPKTAPKGRY